MNKTALIGLKIKEIRKKKKISQEKLAEMVSMSHRSIVRLENLHTIPTIETLEKIADALNVDITAFFETETIKTRQQITNEINKIITSMTDEDLKTLYKAIYHFIH